MEPAATKTYCAKHRDYRWTELEGCWFVANNGLTNAACSEGRTVTELPGEWHTVGSECRDPYCEHEVLEGHHHGPLVAARTTACDKCGGKGERNTGHDIYSCSACEGRGFLWPDSITEEWRCEFHEPFMCPGDVGEGREDCPRAQRFAVVPLAALGIKETP